MAVMKAFGSTAKAYRAWQARALPFLLSRPRQTSMGK